MAESRDGRTPVSSILVASDLSSRCDRALDRAIDLALAWGATIHVVTAIEKDFHQPSWRSNEITLTAKAQAEVAEVIGGRPVAWSVAVVPARPEDAVTERARQVDADLIVTGTARDELLGRMKPGRTVDALIHNAPAPVLVVKRRPTRSYRRMLVPTDYTLAAEFALARAAELWPEAEFTLLHAYRVPFSAFLSEDAHRGEMKEFALDELDAFLDRVRARTGRPGQFRSLVEYGEAGQLVRDFVEAQEPDLMVLGAHDHRGLLGLLTPDVAGRLLMAVNCDVLVAPELGELARKARRNTEPASGTVSTPPGAVG